MFKGVYLNKVTQGIELMVCDAFIEANEHYKFHQLIDNTEEYVKLTDNILEEMEYSTNPELSKSREIIKKIKNRDIYRYVAEVILEREFPLADKEELIKTEIASLSSKHGIDEIVSPKDVYLLTGNVNFGLRNENPAERTKFFHKGDLSSRETVN